MKSRLRRRVYRLLDPRASRTITAVNAAVIGLILIAVVLSVAETEPAVVAGHERLLARINFGLGIVFLGEYGLRLWCVAERMPARPLMTRLRFMVTLASLVDVATIVSSLVPILGFNSTPLRLIRVARIVRLVRVGPIGHAAHMLASAIAARRYELLVTAGLALIVMLVGATALYWAEGEVQPDKFGSIPRAMWWSVVTLTTIGYGDVYPVTPLGKVLASLMAFAGVGVIALPTGIMASAFSDALRQRRSDAASSAGERPT